MKALQTKRKRGEEQFASGTVMWFFVQIGTLFLNRPGNDSLEPETFFRPPNYLSSLQS